MDEELRQREREREKEREREADREREKEREREREKELEREREKERERELERQRERAREKELSMVKAMEGPFLPVAELHGLRGHPAEERGKPVEPLAPSRAGTARLPQLALVPSPLRADGKAEGVGGPGRWLGTGMGCPGCQIALPGAQLQHLRASARCLCHLTRAGLALCPVHAGQLGWQRAGSPLSCALTGGCPTAPRPSHPQGCSPQNTPNSSTA